MKSQLSSLCKRSSLGAMILTGIFISSSVQASQPIVNMTLLLEEGSPEMQLSMSIQEQTRQQKISACERDHAGNKKEIRKCIRPVRKAERQERRAKWGQNMAERRLERQDKREERRDRAAIKKAAKKCALKPQDERAACESEEKEAIINKKDSRCFRLKGQERKNCIKERRNKIGAMFGKGWLWGK